MTKLAQWQQQYANRLVSLSNKELWEEFLDAQMPDDYSGLFTNRGAWYRDYSLKAVETRLTDWLNMSIGHSDECYD